MLETNCTPQRHAAEFCLLQCTSAADAAGASGNDHKAEVAGAEGLGSGRAAINSAVELTPLPVAIGLPAVAVARGAIGVEVVEGVHSTAVCSEFLLFRTIAYGNSVLFGCIRVVFTPQRCCRHSLK